ncbi:DUF2798 domain-containing protein [Clostridium estertheticum]|uniref:DUF2798 domain-containing protein n=1 Tax=Clostridium estertheticum TaxID=238834 RepID=A0AA47I6D7_9CLOT|nr:DUF2798 domain-containing protein [Clostridium estertheticum]MBU3157527.1 DUF2798 domain-containing protein [Clostridium estertheticum]MBU3202238.1 DUF2798 domain-containing protein [Clostridium estertheticum]WAG59720.1 DUF2798 domain-containing protein [Clostridium estertheticum]WAG66208.1 DUF2798 domain-containing protein [Clostridium estertheticum]
MEKCMPTNAKEGLIYGGVICALTCIFMATMNICINMGGVSGEAVAISLKSIPLVFIIAMIIENFIVGKIADKLVNAFISPTDSLNSHIMFRTFFTVIGMSIIMTIVGGSLANGFSLEAIKEFPINWPRNFCVAIFLELIIVQPIARTVMRRMHEFKEKYQTNNGNDNELDNSLD